MACGVSDGFMTILLFKLWPPIEGPVDSRSFLCSSKELENGGASNFEGKRHTNEKNLRHPDRSCAGMLGVAKRNEKADAPS